MIVYRGEDAGFVDSIILGDGTSLGSFLKKAKKSSQKELDKFVAENLDDAIKATNEIASEHMEIVTRDPFSVMTRKYIQLF